MDRIALDTFALLCYALLDFTLALPATRGRYFLGVKNQFAFMGRGSFTDIIDKHRQMIKTRPDAVPNRDVGWVEVRNPTYQSY